MKLSPDEIKNLFVLKVHVQMIFWPLGTYANLTRSFRKHGLPTTMIFKIFIAILDNLLKNHALSTANAEINSITYQPLITKYLFIDTWLCPYVAPEACKCKHINMYKAAAVRLWSVCLL